MAKVINLTQHKSTPEQNCRDLQGRDLDHLKELLTFNALPTSAEIDERARHLVALASKEAYWNTVSDHDLSPLEDEDEIIARTRGTKVMIGGAPYLMGPLTKRLKAAGLVPAFSFTERKAVEKMVNGEVVKTSVFSHIGWVEA